MRRWWLAALPVLSGGAAALAAATDAPVEIAGAVGAAVGVVAAAVVGLALRRRADVVAERLGSASPGTDTAPASEAFGDLGPVFAGVGEAVQHRIDAAAAERERMVRLLERLPLAIMLFEGDRLAFANAAAERLLDLDMTRARGQRSAQVLEAAELADAVGEAQQTGADAQAEAEQRGRDLVGRAVPTAAGEVALLVTDLTEARRVDAVRRDFVANASHELRTPVAGLQALSESLALALDRDPERARGMVTRIEHEAARLSATTRDLLDLARLEETAGEDAVQYLDLADVVAEQLDLVTPHAAERGIRLERALVVGAMVRASREDLRLIVANLLENAVRYNRDGGWVGVTLRRSGGELALDVADSGIGIPEADQDRIFERFYRVDKGRSRAEGGTGLGLSLVRNAAQRHGGRVAVVSDPGEGSTFTVTLPAAPLE